MITKPELNELEQQAEHAATRVSDAMKKLHEKLDETEQFKKDPPPKPPNGSHHEPI